MNCISDMFRKLINDLLEEDHVELAEYIEDYLILNGTGCKCCKCSPKGILIWKDKS